MPEYIISQRDPRGERTEQLAAVKAAHTYNMEYGFPVSTGPDEQRPEPVLATQGHRGAGADPRQPGSDAAPRQVGLRQRPPAAGPPQARHDGAQQRRRRAPGLLHARAGRRQGPRSDQDPQRVPGHLRDHPTARRRRPVRIRRVLRRDDGRRARPDATDPARRGARASSRSPRNTCRACPSWRTRRSSPRSPQAGSTGWTTSR